MTNSQKVLVGLGDDPRYLSLAQVAPSVRRDVLIDPALMWNDHGFA